MVLVGVVLLASILASFSDWLFYDVLVYRFYQANPEVWRSGGRARVAISQAVGTLASAAAVEVTVLVHGRPFWVGVCLWAAGPLPATLQNLQWMRIHPAVGASHAAGWLVRLMIATVLAASVL